MDRRLHVLLVDPGRELRQIERALRSADEGATTETVASPDAVGDAEADPDCIVVLDGDAVDGIEQLSAVLDRVDGVPVIPVSVAPSSTFAAEARSAGAADVICVPRGESADELFPELVARRLRHVAGHVDPFESESALLDALLEDLPHQVFIKNEHGRFEDASGRAAAEYDLDREQLVGLTDSDLIPPDVVAELRAEETEIMETEEPVINKIEHVVDGEGRDRWMSTTKAPRYDGDGEVVGTIGTTRDVTEGKRQEEMLNALHAASRRLLAAETRREIAEIAVDIADDVPDLPLVQVTFVEDGELLPIAASNSERGRSGARDARARDREPTRTAVSDDADSPDLPDAFERYEGLLRRCHETETAQFVAPDGDRDGGSPRENALDPEAMALPLGEHGVLGFASTSGTFDEFGVDLAEVLAANVEATLDRAAREETLARQNEQLEEFASIVSHDLRNPLTVAQGYVDLLRTDGTGAASPRRDGRESRGDSSPRSATPHENAEEQSSSSPRSSSTRENAVEEIDRALGRIESLTDDLLVLARNGKVVDDTSPEALDSVVFEAWRAADTGTASLRVAGSLGTVEADRERLLELFENLFANAIEHAHDSGDPAVVTVGALESGFYVEDDGPGVPDERKERIFDRGHSTGADGTGLGLHVVETIAGAHGWSVRATDATGGGERPEGSRSPDGERSESSRGARFEITSVE